jgi:pyruvate dehydrogenase E1 component alpha subunit
LLCVAQQQERILEVVLMSPLAGLTDERLIELLQQMRLIRAFEWKADQLYAEGKVHGTMHLSIGQEATAVGAIAALERDDYIFSTHRGHGHCLAKGADVKLMMAEFRGKETGYCRGRGGSMHIADLEGGNLGANGVVGGGLAMACGAALVQKMQKTGKVVLCFFGDGASNQGIFHESLNLAAIWQLPVVYFCENNQYGMSMHVTRSTSVERISERGCAYGIPGQTVDGNDLLQVYEATGEAVSRAREGGGPTLLEGITYRWKGHSKSDADRYRTKEEIEEWKAKDPITRFEKLLLGEGVLTRERASEIEAWAQQEIDSAVEFAETCPEPSLETIEEGVYA